MNTIIVPGTAGSEQAEALRKITAKVNADAEANWHNPEWRRAFAQTFTTTIMEGFTHENILNYLAEVETVGIGDRITVEEVKGLEVFWVSNGGQIDVSRITSEVWELPRDFIGFHVYELNQKMRTNFSRAASQITSLAIGQIDAAINSRLLRLYQAVIDNASPYYIGGAGLSLSALNTAITEVQDISKSDVVTIVGRGTMTAQIMDQLAELNGFTPETNETVLRTGRIGTYRGANIVRLPNHRDANGASFVPANELYVAARDAAKVGFWGGLETQEWSEQGGWYWHAMGVRTAGFTVHKPEHVRRIVDTSMPA